MRRINGRGGGLGEEGRGFRQGSIVLAVEMERADWSLDSVAREIRFGNYPGWAGGQHAIEKDAKVIPRFSS